MSAGAASSPAPPAPPVRRAAVLVVGAVAVSLLVHTWPTLDIWYHLRRGLDIVETGQALPPGRFVVQHPDAVFYWLFQLVVAGLYALGAIPAVTLFFAAVWLGAFALLFRASGLLNGGGLAVLWMLAALILAEMRMDPRPEALSFLFVAAVLALIVPLRPPDLLDDRRRAVRVVALLAGIQVLWCNVHGYFVLGPLLVGLKGLHLLSEAPPGARVRLARLGGVILIGLLAASCVSPFGPRTLVSAVIHLGLLREVHDLVLEFRSPLDAQLVSGLWTFQLFWTLWACVALAALRQVVRARRIDFTVSLALVGLLLGANSIRLMVFLVIFATPLVGRVLAEIEPRRPPATATRTRRTAWSRWAYPAALVVAACGVPWVTLDAHYESIGSRKRFGFGRVGLSHPDRIVDYLARHPTSGLLFNVDYAGSYLEFRLPTLRLYGNTQFTSPEAVRAYHAAATATGFWRLHEAWHFDAALVDVVTGNDTAQGLLGHPGWRLVHADLLRALFVRRDSPHATELPPEPPVFIADEDLSFPPCALAAIRWAELLAGQGERELLARLLDQLAGSERDASVGQGAAQTRQGAARATPPFIPGAVLGYALELALSVRDGALVQRAARLRPRANFASHAEQQAIDIMLQQGARLEDRP